MGRRIEIQVRTEFQNQWALLSEKAADRWGQNIKYGEGRSDLLSALQSMSEGFNKLEVYISKFGSFLDVSNAQALVSLQNQIQQFLDEKNHHDLLH